MSAAAVTPESSASSSSPSIKHRIPDRMLHFTMEYTNEPTSRQSIFNEGAFSQLKALAWSHRHRDQPAVFRQSQTIEGFYSTEQNELINQIWKKGWQEDESSPLMKLVGWRRKSSAHHHTTEAGRTSSVKIALIEHPHQDWVLQDISLRDKKNTFQSLRKGPILFQTFNLVDAPGFEISEKQDPSCLQMLLGQQGSYTSVHYDWYGADGYLHLLEGEKIWFMGPPSSHEVMQSMFGKGNVGVTHWTSEMSEACLKHHIHVIHQVPGDCVFTPAGWYHCVKNLTQTVAFGGSYVRAWKLPFTLLWLRTTSVNVDADSSINWSCLFKLLREGKGVEFGITQAEAEAILALYEKNKSRFFKDDAIRNTLTIEDVYNM